MSSFRLISTAPLYSSDSAHLDQQSGRRDGLPSKITPWKPWSKARIHLTKSNRTTQGLFCQKVAVRAKFLKKLLPNSRERREKEEGSQRTFGEARFDLRSISTAMTGGIILLRFAMN